MTLVTDRLTVRGREALLGRNEIFTGFFMAEAPRLAAACAEMSRRFLAGGRLLAFGQAAAATDAQHVSVEFVHPVIVGKRALPALDVSDHFPSRLPVLVQPEDMVMGFSFGADDETVASALHTARQRGALTFAISGTDADWPFSLPHGNAFIAQEVCELLYHMLWETVHVFFEHREQGHDVGASSFLYPFLGSKEQNLDAVDSAVHASMVQKLEEVNRLRTVTAETAADALAATATAIAARLLRGGKLLIFGNGGSATDANDLAIDCVMPPPGLRPVPAISLAAEPANITAIANDIGAEAIFTRQLIAHGHPADVAIGISTSGGSPNIVSALAEARRQGMLTVALAGYDGGRIVAERLADHVLVVNSDYIPRIQEVQASIYHVLRGLIDEIVRA